jgi:hypothetical protein
MKKDKIKNTKQQFGTKKKWTRFIPRTFTLLLIVVLLLMIISNIPFVQTFIVGQISDKLSQRLQTRISIESVNISFFNRMRINGIYIEDTEHDTLMYVSHLDAVIGNLPLNGRTLTLKKLRLSDGIFCLRSDSVNTNIVKLINRLKNQEEQTTVEENGEQETEKLQSTESVEDMMVNTFRIRTKSLELRNFKYLMYLNDAPTQEEQPEGIIYKNMSISDINLDADRISVKSNTLTFRVNEFSFKERSGLNVRQIVADTGIICFGKEVTLKEFKMIDDFSNIRIRNLSLLYDGGNDFSDFINKVNLVIDVYDSKINFSTLGYFAPSLNKIPVTANFNGQITGHVADLRSDNFNLKTLTNTYIDGRFSIFGLPDIENTMIFLDLKHLDTSPGDVINIVEGVTGKRFGEKETLHKFGNMHFNGTYTGLISDFVAYGYLKSELGVLEMDILFNNQKKAIEFDGELAAVNFNVGRFLQSPLLGYADFNMEVYGTVLSGKNDIFGQGNISSLEFNDYKYRNVELKGRLVSQSFDGEVRIAEPNLDLDFKGNIDLNGEEGIPVFNFNANLRHADLVKLNFNKRDSVSVVSADITANFRASSILDYVGELTVDSLLYTDYQRNVDLGKINLSSYNGENGNYLELSSGFMDARYFGYDGLENFVERLQCIIQKHVPELFSKKMNPLSAKQYMEYDFRASFKNAEDITRILVPDLHIEKGTKLNAIIDTGSILNIYMT